MTSSDSGPHGSSYAKGFENPGASSDTTLSSSNSARMAPTHSLPDSENVATNSNIQGRFKRHYEVIDESEDEGDKQTQTTKKKPKYDDDNTSSDNAVHVGVSTISASKGESLTTGQHSTSQPKSSRTETIRSHVPRSIIHRVSEGQIPMFETLQKMVATYNTKAKGTSAKQTAQKQSLEEEDLKRTEQAPNIIRSITVLRRKKRVLQLSYPDDSSGAYSAVHLGPSFSKRLRLSTPPSLASIESEIAKPPFRLIDRILDHPELCLRLATVMNPKDLVTLYATSKPFHWIVNSHFTTYVRSAANYHAPDSSWIFPWRCYRRLTIKDPGWRYITAMPNTFRDVPGLKWLQMVTQRHSTVIDILTVMENAGHRFPPTRSVTKNSITLETSDMVRAVKRIWFMLDLPRNLGRVGVAHNTTYWTDRDIFLAIMFFFKLDMHFADPIEGQGETQLRVLMTAQRTLIPLRRLLMGGLTSFDILQMKIQHNYTPQLEHRNLPILGIPAALVGAMCREGWGTQPHWSHRLMGVDEIMLRESVRRNLGLHMRLLDYLRWGHNVVDKKTVTGTISQVKSMPRMKHSQVLEEWVKKTLYDDPLLWMLIDDDMDTSDTLVDEYTDSDGMISVETEQSIL